ncbi:MAG: class I SAM-dependent methyltransferase [Deltaproteobacteria bacterium]|nr:class I SAM-dependent methyltransferase [Deltaproteobacteria bacterium]
MAVDTNIIYDQYADPYDRILLNWSCYRELRDCHLQYVKDANKVLDHGAGTGNQTIELLKAGKEVVAIDVNESMLDVLREKCRPFSQRLTVHTMDAHNLALGDKEFDAVTSMNVIYNLQNPIKAMEEAFRVLKNGGVFLLSGPNPSADHSKIDEVMDKALIPELKEKFLYEGLKEEVEQVREVNKKLMDLPTRYSADEVSSLLVSEIGFEKVIYASDTFYRNAGHFVAVRK